MLNSQLLLYINLGLGVLFVAYFVFGRPRVKPLKLDLKAKVLTGRTKADHVLNNSTLLNSKVNSHIDSKNDHNLKNEHNSESSPASLSENNDTRFQKYKPKYSYQDLDVDNITIPVTPAKERNLSVLFMYNGHDWEAHSVLGVPQGCSMHQITVSYQEQIKKADPSSFPFLESAYKVLSDKHKKHRL